MPDTHAPVPRTRKTDGGQRPALARRARVDFLLDAILFVSFGIAYTFNFTGDALHEWFGLGFACALLVHLTLHWDWVVGTTRRMFSKSGRRRVIWIVNVLLLTDMVLCVASGIAISLVAIPALGIHSVSGSGYWEELHRRTASLAVLLIAIHIGFDFRWIVSVARRMIRKVRT